MKPILILAAVLLAATGARGQIVTECRLENLPQDDPRIRKAYLAVKNAIQTYRPTAYRTAISAFGGNEMQRRGLGMNGTSNSSEPEIEPTRWNIGESITIFQTISPGSYLAHRDDQLIMVTIAGQPLPDGQSVRGVLNHLPNLYTYTTAIGTTATVKRFDLQPSPDASMNIDTFLARLKAGETFIIPNGEKEQRCPKCNGWGRVAGTRAGSPKQPCKHCKETGKRAARAFLKILW